MPALTGQVGAALDYYEKSGLLTGKCWAPSQGGKPYSLRKNRSGKSQIGL